PFKENDTIKFLLSYPDTTGYTNLKRSIVGCLLANPKIKQADMAFVCCAGVDLDWMVFIGVSDKSKGIVPNAKTGDLELPLEITKAYDSLDNLIAGAVLSGNDGDDHSQGHALFAYPPARRIQEKFITYAEIHLSLLKNVIRNS